MNPFSLERITIKYHYYTFVLRDGSELLRWWAIRKAGAGVAAAAV